MALKHDLLENGIGSRKIHFAHNFFQAESTPFREARQPSANHILSGPWGLVGVGTELCVRTRRQRSFFSCYRQNSTLERLHPSSHSILGFSSPPAFTCRP